MEEELKEEVTEEATSNPYEIDYSDSRFADVESAKTAALSNVDSTYGDMINKTDDFYQQQIDANKQWEEKQTQLQQDQTDFAIEQIEQQKEYAEKDYLKEQSGAYKDWQKQSNQYGVNAEQMASQGMTNTGYSESSRVAMYNAYQSRVSAARESYVRAVQDFDNDITSARLQNNSAMAQLAFESFQQRLELALSGFQYKNQLVLDQADKKLEIESLYHGRWMDVLDQMNKENSLAEQIRQFNESMAEEQRQFNYYNKLGEFAEGGSGGSSGGGGSGTVSFNTWLANLSNKDRKAYEASQNATITPNGLPQHPGAVDKISQQNYKMY